LPPPLVSGQLKSLRMHIQCRWHTAVDTELKDPKKYCQMVALRAIQSPHRLGPKVFSQCTRSQSAGLSISNTCREQGRAFSQAPPSLPHDQFTEIIGLPIGLLSPRRKTPHKSTICRASSINMAPDVGIEPATN
jgi:hypothetical protein